MSSTLTTDPLKPLDLPLQALLPSTLGPELDGRSGCNRALTPGLCQIGAADDVAAIAVWLAEFAHSPHTFRSYRKEALRLLSWATRVRRKPVSSLTREDVLTYQAFLATPVAAEWSDEGAPAGRLSADSQRQAMGIAAGLFSYLVNAGYLAGNPWTLRRRRKSVPRVRQVERYLEQAQWAAVLEFLDTLAQERRRECQRYERTRWVVRFFYGTALRVSEAAQARSSDFVRRRGKWWLRVRGKGGVYGEVPLGDDLMTDFARYRTFHGLPPTPSSLETTPVILSIAGRAEKCLTPTAVYLIVKEAFGLAADALATSDPITAAVLRRASTHWLRHTAASHQADSGTDLRHIQKNLRHASIETTAIYLHPADDVRHRDTTGE
jgi:integrase/recombinase XerC